MNPTLIVPLLLLAGAVPARADENPDSETYTRLDEAKAKFKYDPSPDLPEKVHAQFRHFVEAANAELAKGTKFEQLIGKMGEGDLFLPRAIDIQRASACAVVTRNVCVKATGLKGCKTGRLRKCSEGATNCKESTMRCEMPTLSLCSDVQYCDDSKPAKGKK